MIPTMGEGRPPSHIKLRSAAAVLASCSFDKSSLKTPFKKADLTKLIDVETADYDSWLPSRPEVLERLLKFFYQRYFVAGLSSVTHGGTLDLAAAASAALEECRDLLRDSIADSVHLQRVHKRTKKSRSADPGRDLIFMIHCIDAHAVPVSAASISVDIEKRRLMLGVESVATFLEELMNMCAGHLDAAAVRTRFIVGVTLALDEAEQQATFNPMLIDAVRDIVADVNLPVSNDELREKLERTSATSRIWTKTSAMGPVRSAKEARTHETHATGQHTPTLEQEFQQKAAVSFESPPRALGLSLPPPQVSPPQQPPTVAAGYYGSPAHQQQWAEQQQQQVPPNSAESFYGAPGYQQQQGGYQQQQYGGRGYGGGKGGYKGGGYSGGYGGGRGSDGKGGGYGGFDGKGKGGKGVKDPNGPTKFYDVPAIIATGLIWPKDTKLYWNNPARINADGTGDGLYGLDCPLCGKNKKRVFTWEEYCTHFGAPPGLGMGKHPQPADVVVYHRGLKCKEGEWDIGAYARDHADAPACFKSFMTEGSLAAFKMQVPTPADGSA